MSAITGFSPAKFAIAASARNKTSNPRQDFARMTLTSAVSIAMPEPLPYLRQMGTDDLEPKRPCPKFSQSKRY